MLRPELVRRKLHLISDDLERLVVFRDETLAALVADPLRMAAVERLLERIVMRAIDVNEHLLAELAADTHRCTRLTYRDTFVMLAPLGVYAKEFAERIANSAGLRNILVHDYNDADRAIVHAAIRDCLREYHAYVEHVEHFLAKTQGAVNARA